MAWGLLSPHTFLPTYPASVWVFWVLQGTALAMVGIVATGSSRAVAFLSALACGLAGLYAIGFVELVRHEFLNLG